MINEANAKSYLHNRGLKATPIRVELLTYLAKHTSAMPYSSIQQYLKCYDRVTLYRTINALMESGIVHKASTTDDEVYYALCNQECSKQCHKHEHIHFKCKTCSEVSCIHVEQTMGIELPGYQIDEISIEVSGTCSKCLSS